MLVAGTGDGTYLVTGLATTADTAVEKVLDVPRVERVRQFDAVDGVFAASETGLYHSPDGRDWSNLGVPVETVWAVAASPSGDRLYAGTRPTHVYTASLPGDGRLRPDDLDWTEQAGFRELPDRDDWGVERHGGVAQLRDLRLHPDSPDRVVAGVEPGGVHVSTDGGETWTRRNDGVHDDVHGLYVEDDGTYVAATGVGLYRTTDAGRSWARLDEGLDQRYFRAVTQHDGELYTSAACVPPNRWTGPEAEPRLLASRDGETLEPIESPRPDEVVVGWTTVDDALVGVTDRGTVVEKRGDDWNAVGEIPTPDTLYGRYCNLTWVGE